MMDLFATRNIKPMLLTETGEAFDDPDWIYELKLDGIRAIVYLDGYSTDIRNKENRRLISIYPELANIYRQARERCILDGELVVIKQGKPDFEEMRRRSLMSDPFRIKLSADRLPVSFVTFDILQLGDEELIGKPLLERKELLTGAVTENDRLAISRFIRGEGRALYEKAEQNELEGVVAKRSDSRYVMDKRSKDWVKIKNLKDEDFIICGYKLEGNMPSLILGVYDAEHRLVYQGHVSLGVSAEDMRVIRQVPTMEPSKYDGFPYEDSTQYIEPRLMCTVRYMERTQTGGLRQPVFHGIINHM